MREGTENLGEISIDAKSADTQSADTQSTLGMDDAGVLARFVGAQPGTPDLAAHHLLAYALHRRALIDFRADFAAHRRRLPSEAEEAVFLIGDLTETRISAYRAAASAMIASANGPKSPAVAPAATLKRQRRWPWLGMWVEPPLAPSDTGPINWRGFAFRLLVLLLAVVTTALLLRVLIVKT